MTMITETIVTTRAADGRVHIAPLGMRQEDGLIVLAPFRPSASLDNILARRSAVINFTADVRVFAGCIVGRRNWATVDDTGIAVPRLAAALTHWTLELVDVEDDPMRPELRLRRMVEVAHAPFQGLNRAQAAVIEAAILVSRLRMLPPEKIATELAYLRIAVDKTAGPDEREAWGWLMERVDAFFSAPVGHGA